MYVPSCMLTYPLLTLNRIRPKHITEPAVGKENIPPARNGRLSINSPAALDRLVKPFKCPGSVNSRRVTAEPPRKRRKVNYTEEGGGQADSSGGYTGDDNAEVTKN
jgi:DNA repair and recombination protein RAD54 and RAD54-like protein